MSKITVTKEQVDEIINASHVYTHTAFDKTTIVLAKLPNGFVIVESSSCVDPANYNQDIGYGICMERIRNKVCELEGYVLQCEMNHPALREWDPEIPAYQKSVVVEHAELIKKCDDLNYFFNDLNGGAGLVGTTQFELLQLQLRFMNDYLNVLEKRMALFQEPPAYHDDDRQYHSHPTLVYDSTKHGWPPEDGKDPYTDAKHSVESPRYAQMCGRAVRTLHPDPFVNDADECRPSPT